jgi:hypothetical protein
MYLKAFLELRALLKTQPVSNLSSTPQLMTISLGYIQFSCIILGQVVEHPLARPILPLIPTQIRNLILSSAEAEALINDYDSAGHYLSQWAGDLQSRLTGKKKLEIVDTKAVDKTRDFEVLSVSIPYGDFIVPHISLTKPRN